MLPINHPNIIRLRRGMGMEGFGIYVAICSVIEQSGNQPIPIDIDAISYEFHTDEDKVRNVIFDFSLFDIDEETDSITMTDCPPPAKPLSRTERAVKAAQARWGAKDEPTTTNQPAQPLEMIVECESKKRPRKSPDPAHNECRKNFVAIYQSRFKEEFYWQPKDANALKTILGQIRFKMPEDEKNSTEKVVMNFTAFIQACLARGDSFLLNHFNLPFIASQFNDIYNQLKNGTQQHANPNDSGFSPEIQSAMRELGIDI